MKTIPFLFLAFFIFGFSLTSFATFCNTAGSIVSVKKTKSGKTEYVIFTVKLPYSKTPVVTNAVPPFIQDGSGNTISVQGCKYKKIVFDGVEWTCTIHEYFSNPTTLIKQVKNIGQFEGVVSYIVGYKCTTSHFLFYSYTAGAYTKYVMRFK